MEKDIIYIAGTPGAYPLEYYDRDTQSYQGVIPELLRRFSEQSRYDVRYYSPGEKDQRQTLAANRQVDLISCPEDLEAVPHRMGEDILLLEDGGNGQAAALCLLDVAPGGLANDLRAFLSETSRQELTALVLQVARDNPPQNRQRMQNIFFGLVLAAALLAAVLIYVAVSSRRKLKALRRERERDPVTGIGNREYLERYSRRFLNDRNRILYTLFCFCFDPTALPGAEDQDAFLRHMAAVLQEYASDTDLLARVSDNGFALLRLSPGERDAAEWLSGVLDHLRRTWQDGGGRPPGITVGACPLKADSLDWNELLLRGMRAAQIARQSGTDYQFVREEALQDLQEERRLRADLRSGLQNREFPIYLHFYADARTGRAAGAEARVLWEHPEKGLLPASRWLPLLEQEGLSESFDDFVLEQLCVFLDFLRQNGREDFFLLYRPSGDTLSSKTLEERWRKLLEGSRFNRRQLLFSVPQEAAAEGVEALRSMGMGLVLDGFDGQPASLAQARETGFWGVKLGKALAGQAETPSGRVVLEAVFRAGHALELTFLAEGGTPEDPAGRLGELGCDLLCGDRPFPLWEAMKKLAVRKTGEPPSTNA